MQVTEWDEPQAVIGSYLQRYAYPDYFDRHQKNCSGVCRTRTSTPAARSRCLQLRGEYLYAAEGKRGMQVYDVASVANKGVSQRDRHRAGRPVSGTTHAIASKDATAWRCRPISRSIPRAIPAQLMRDDNEEQPFHPIYNYALITDRARRA